MRRTQLYLDDHLWSVLHAKARSGKTTLSELVREAVRERYLGKRGERIRAMQAFIGIRKVRATEPDAVQEIRNLRRGDRLDRFHQE